MDITWDKRKFAINKAKHGISFADLEPVFYDPYAISIEDNDAVDEQRFITIGSDSLGRIITIVYIYREHQYG